MVLEIDFVVDDINWNKIFEIVDFVSILYDYLKLCGFGM